MTKNDEPGIGRLIARIRQGIYNFVAECLKDKDLDVGQFFFLRFVVKNDGETQEQIARNILLDKATVSKGIKRLVQLGYVSKKVNPDDKREFKIFATEKARMLIPELDSIYNEVYDKLHHNLDKDEIVQLQSLLKIVYKNFE